MTTDLTPEHTARHPDSDSYSEVIAAYQYVQSVIPTADVQSSAGGYAWHGWALREAFLAGCTHARAALADEPAVPEGREPASVTGQPSDGDLDVLMYSIPWKGSPSHWGRQVVRAALTRWGNPAPQPPAEEEVAWLREIAQLWKPDAPRAKQLFRAADLLERQFPQPMPVSERLPGPEYCDAKGRCWLHFPDMGIEPLWRLTDPSLRSRYHSHWLPFTALPLPSGEVE